MNQTVNNISGSSTIKIMLGIIILVLVIIVGLIVEPRIRLGKIVNSFQKVDDTRVMIKNMETALKLYKLDNGSYPTTEQGLKSLVVKPTSGKIPKNYKADGYLYDKTVPKDPWGNDYIYQSPGDHGEYDLSSYGADGYRGGEGLNADIENWISH